MFINYNVNPCENRTIDCTVRALSTLLGRDWYNIYVQLCFLGYEICDMPSSKTVVNLFLKDAGYKRHLTPDRACGYTVKEFTIDHPRGKYLLAADSHVVPVIDGNYIDTWDSGYEMPLFYWEEE